MPDTSKLSEAKRALLEKYLHGEITQSTVTSSPIIEEHPVASSQTNLRVPVVPIQTSGTKRPFFYLHVHAIGGAFYCFTLAHDLGPDQPFYILDPYSFDNQEMPPTLETMATAYIESLRTVQPEGPYLLGGFCGGGIIAFEMAQQLRKQGQEVDLVLQIEPRDGPAPHRLLFRKLLCGSFRRFGLLLGVSPQKPLEWFLYVRYIGLRLIKSKYRADYGSLLVPPTTQYTSPRLDRYLCLDHFTVQHAPISRQGDIPLGA